MDRDVFTALFPKVFGPARLGETTLGILKDAADPEVRAQLLIQHFNRNPAYEHFLFRMDMLRERIQTWFQEDEKNPDIRRIVLERILGLLGKAPIRNATLAFQFNRIQGVNLPRKKSDRIQVAPQDQLKFAISVETYCYEHNLSNAFEAFEGALHYDLLRMLLTRSKAPKDALGLIDTVQKNAFKLAITTYAIGSLMKGMSLSRYLFAASLASQTGKVLLGLQFPKDIGDKSYAAFVAETEKLPKDKQEIAAFLRESKRFPVTHGELSAAFIGFVGRLKGLEPVMTSYLTPWDLSGGSTIAERELFQMALALFVGNRLANESPLTTHHQKALKVLGVPEEKLHPLVKKLVQAAQGGKG